MTAPKSPELANKLQKLARLARCPAAAKGEKVNAATMLVTIARKNHVDLAGYSDLVAMAAASASKPQRSPMPTSKPWEPPRSKPRKSKPQPLVSAMPNGQYRGKTIEELFKLDPGYLFWFLKAYPTRRKMRSSIMAFLKTEKQQMTSQKGFEMNTMI